MAGQTITGKAFEYACFRKLASFAGPNGEDTGEGPTTTIQVSSPQLDTAYKSYKRLDEKKQNIYNIAAHMGMIMIRKLEPMLSKAGGNIYIILNTDSAGQAGDVRDVIAARMDQGWELGISCKHQHEALKHPRITKNCDFGSDWVDIPCSNNFINTLNEVLKPLDGSKNWTDFPDKQSRFYVPILNAFEEELRRLCSEPGVPERLLKYFFGSHDFYKIIAMDRERQTKIYGFNINGTLSKADGKRKPIHKIPQLKMPTRLIEVSRKPQSRTTLLLVFDAGWTISMRLHNKDKIAKPTSLAWDVNLAGLPSDVYQQQISWD